MGAFEPHRIMRGKTAATVMPSSVGASEQQIQFALIHWCRLFKDERRHAFHIPNEGRRTQVGHACQVKAGLRKGASDLFIPAQRGGYGGMFLELKAPGQKPTKEQSQFESDLTACGYYCLWADSLDLAMLRIDEYMDAKVQRPDWLHYSRPVTVA